MSSGGARAATDAVNAVAERYVQLVLALGRHDPDYVDAFYGPAEWKTQAEKERKSLDAIGTEDAELTTTLTKTPDQQRSSWKSLLTALPIPQLTLAPKVRTITHLSPRFLRRSIKTN
jgi:hypothetical protein